MLTRNVSVHLSMSCQVHFRSVAIRNAVSPSHVEVVGHWEHMAREAVSPSHVEVVGHWEHMAREEVSPSHVEVVGHWEHMAREAGLELGTHRQTRHTESKARERGCKQTVTGATQQVMLHIPAPYIHGLAY